MAFGFGEDKKFFGLGGNNSTVSSPVEKEEQAPVVNPAPTASPDIVAKENDGMEAKIGEYTSKINDVEAKIKDLYCEIGEMYFDIHSEDAEYELEVLVNAVKDKMSLIDDFKAKINEIKGIVICDKCGAETKNTSTFCAECGNKIKKVVEVAPAGQMVCSNCNCFIDEGSKFCPICGAKVEGAKTVSVATETPISITPAVEPVAPAVNEAEPVESDDKVEDGLADTISEKVEDAIDAVTDTVKEAIDDFDSDDEDDMPFMKKIDFGGEPKECPSCGQKLESFDMICFACGRKL